MATKRRLKNIVLPVTETSADSFWEAAFHERDPAKNLKITRKIDQTIREHERNVFGARLATGKPSLL